MCDVSNTWLTKPKKKASQKWLDWRTLNSSTPHLPYLRLCGYAVIFDFSRHLTGWMVRRFLMPHFLQYFLKILGLPSWIKQFMGELPPNRTVPRKAAGRSYSSKFWGNPWLGTMNWNLFTQVIEIWGLSRIVIFKVQDHWVNPPSKKMTTNWNMSSWQYADLWSSGACHMDFK